MKKISVILYVLVFMLCFTACDSTDINNMKEDEKVTKLEYSAQQTDEFINISMEVYDKNRSGIDIAEDDSLLYHGEPFEFYVKVENNADFPVTVCLSALMKSHLQPFVVGDSEEEVMSCTAEIQGKEYHEFHLYVDPVVAYADRDTFIQYMLYTTKGIKAIRAKEALASTISTMSEVSVRAESEDYNRIPDVDDFAEPAIKEKTEIQGNSLGVLTKIGDQWAYPPTDIYLSNDQQVYISATSTEESDVKRFVIIVYVDGKIVKGFDGKYGAVFEQEEETINYFSVDNKVISSKGEHVISAMLIPIEYHDEDPHNKKKLMEENRYWVMMGNEGLFNFR